MEEEEERYLNSQSEHTNTNNRSRSRSRLGNQNDQEDSRFPFQSMNSNIIKPQQGSSKCFVYTLLIIVVFSIFLLIFAAVVLRIQPPTLRLSDVHVGDLRRTNATLLAHLRLHNPNFGRFNFRAGNATFRDGSGGGIIGAASIGGGGVGRRESREFNVTMKVKVKLDKELDLIEMKSFGKLKGEVRVVKIVGRRRSAVLNCSMGLNVTSRQIQDLSCQ
ncbi:uncharacterized protein LOC127255413 [Andrographis paniculata]|uniref:uncharacterized protein LOC127255413 n=1 Tax=Andrographis paniculata TaxID=175694 RepID=UPI0021E98F8A|nr:uncharacterized protein LOC127255413 [Andrographis paniculata]